MGNLLDLCFNKKSQKNQQLPRVCNLIEGLPAPGPSSMKGCQWWRKSGPFVTSLSN